MGDVWNLRATHVYKVGFKQGYTVPSVLEYMLKWLEGQSFKREKSTTPNMLKVTKKGIHINFMPELSMTFTPDNTGAVSVFLHYYAKIQYAKGIVVGVLTSGLSTAVGVGTFAAHVVDAKKFVEAIWVALNAVANAPGVMVSQEGFDAPGQPGQQQPPPGGYPGQQPGQYGGQGYGQPGAPQQYGQPPAQQYPPQNQQFQGQQYPPQQYPQQGQQYPQQGMPQQQYPPQQYPQQGQQYPPQGMPQGAPPGQQYPPQGGPQGQQYPGQGAPQGQQQFGQPTPGPTFPPQDNTDYKSMSLQQLEQLMQYHKDTAWKLEREISERKSNPQFSPTQQQFGQGQQYPPPQQQQQFQNPAPQ